MDGDLEKKERISILVVEDQLMILDELVDILVEDLGYRVSAAVSSGEAALNAVEAEFPDLVLMDIHLEGEMDGISVAKILNERYEYQLPIIYVTDSFDAETRALALPTRPSNYLVKPYEDHELAFAIQMALFNKEHDRDPDSEFEESDEKAEEGPNILNNRIFIRHDNHHIKIDLTDVLWAEANGAYVNFVTAHKKFTLTNCSLEDLESKLPGNRFVRVHRSFILNLDKVKAFNAYSITVDGSEHVQDLKKSMQNLGGRIPITARYRENFEKRFRMI